MNLTLRLALIVVPTFLLYAASAAESPAADAPPLLRVVGNQLRTSAGQPVLLQGLNIPSLEWSNHGEHLTESATQALGEWKANTLRVPLSQDRWFGKAKDQTDAGAAYQSLVRELVDFAAARKAYVVLDLHWSNAGQWGQHLSQHEMPDEHSLTFWKDVAAKYANHPAVLFDLYNEPRDVTWQIWRNGGQIDRTTSKGEHISYKTPGMQALIDAVRAAGAKNIVIAGGLDWAYDLTGVLNGFALQEKGGHGIMYSAHIYPWKRDWEGKVGKIALRHPVFIGEVGCEPDEKQENPYTWAPDVLAYIQKKHLHWTAWCFHPSSSPRMLQDWKYTPTPYWGAFAKSALLGAKFELTKTR